MNARRVINNAFPTQSATEDIGIAFNTLLKSSVLLSEWTKSRIYRSASAFEPIDGISVPYILNQLLTIGSEFFPGKKQRKTVVCGSLFVYEEPFKALEDDDITIVTVVDEFEKILLSDPYLKVGGNRKTERIHKFELSSYGGKPEKDKVTLYLAFRVEYIVDINYESRTKM
jgi:hypothetical protein